MADNKQVETVENNKEYTVGGYTFTDKKAAEAAKE